MNELDKCGYDILKRRIHSKCEKKHKIKYVCMLNK